MARATIFVALFFFQLDLLQCYNDKLLKPNISPECESMGVCIRVDNYPTDLVKELIAKLKSQNTIFNYDKPQPIMSTRFNDYNEDSFSSSEINPWVRFLGRRVNFNNRLSIFENDDVALRSTFNIRVNKKKSLSLCETVSKFEPLQGAKDINGTWQFIINDSEDKIQVFQIATCRTPMGRCSENIGFVPGYDGRCIQKNVFREMFYVNEANETGIGYFEVPTCCSCTLIKKDDDK